MKPYSKVHLLENNLDRNHFTEHGMHLNYKGKDQNAQQLASIAEKIFRKEQPVPIAIPWDIPPMVPYDMGSQDMNTDGKVCEATELTQLQVTAEQGNKECEHLIEQESYQGKWALFYVKQDSRRI